MCVVWGDIVLCRSSQLDWKRIVITFKMCLNLHHSLFCTLTKMDVCCCAYSLFCIATGCQHVAIWILSHSNIQCALYTGV